MVAATAEMVSTRDNSVAFCDTPPESFTLRSHHASQRAGTRRRKSELARAVWLAFPHPSHHDSMCMCRHQMFLTTALIMSDVIAILTITVMRSLPFD